MGTAVSRKKSARSDAISSVAAKVRAARALGDYLSNSERCNGAEHLLSDSFLGQNCDSPATSRLHNNTLHLQSHQFPVDRAYSHQQSQQDLQAPAPPGFSKRQLSVAHSLSAEDPRVSRGPEESEVVKPARVYTITREGGMTLGGRGSEASLELVALKGSRDQPLSQAATSQPSSAAAHGSRHHSSRQRSHQPPPAQPLQSPGNVNSMRRDFLPDCIRAPCQSQRSLDLHGSPRDGGRPRKKLERMYSEDRACADDREDPSSWFPKENMLSFQTASTTLQANFRKHLRMVGSHRTKAQMTQPGASFPVSAVTSFADRRAKSFSRSWSDPTPVKPELLHDCRDSGELQASSGTLDEGLDAEWEDDRLLERVACEGEDFIPPKVVLISSKVPKAEYLPNIIRRNDPSIIPILYDHEHATFDDIIEEIEKKLTAYRKGCRIWNMLIFCQGGPGHLYLLKNKVATFAKVEKEEDMLQFWRRLGRLMSKLNPEPNLIHIMGCYVLGSVNGEKLIQTLKRLMRPSSVEFKSPLELSAQGKEMIELYFDFRLFRLWKTRQHSKLLDYDHL
ncbi:NMDA receptor synaptonuclear signaling and neuronal migration factor-like isoform X2 [Betta splendens]|uniref:NMDA receptor synaptonuclear signaling and neuronal migration factor-like isoform X2 n=1 Tax=Betta splendens TaxID=158456 RepID=A0A6P7L4W8_BETSP|nr:NMDA receptor synaptonuclear signaling and neuronal migration factor-like isoform X2 [Betta splendens]